MTDANGTKHNANDNDSRRLRRASRIAAHNDAPKTETFTSRASGQNASKPNAQVSSTAGKALSGDASSHKLPAAGRRSRRRRTAGRPILGLASSSDKSSKANSRHNRLGNPTGEQSRTLKAVPQSRVSVPGREKTGREKTGREKIGSERLGRGKRTPPSRVAASNGRTATAGSVPLTSSLVKRRSRRPKLPKYAISAIWILVGGLGLATIFGTILANRPGGEPSVAIAESTLTQEITGDRFPITLTQEIPELKSELEKLPTLYPKLSFKAFFVDVDTGDYVDMGGREPLAAASTIKLPILLAFFEEVDKGNIDPNQTIALLKEQVAEGSGDMQLSPPGTQFTALEVATQMIIHSDNTATNMMIALLGGNEALNQRFASYGLEETRLNNPLPDIEGTNTTSARDLVHAMLLVQGDTLKTRSRDRVLNILKRTENKRLLAAGLEEQGALTYNKTGFIDKMLADVALVDLSNGKRYAVAVLVERPDNDGRALELIHSISERTFQYADRAIQPAVTPLGNPNGEASEGAAGAAATPSSSGNEATSNANEAGTTITPAARPAQSEQPSTFSENGEPNVIEEPYPSANP